MSPSRFEQCWPLIIVKQEWMISFFLSFIWWRWRLLASYFGEGSVWNADWQFSILIGPCELAGWPSIFESLTMFVLQAIPQFPSVQSLKWSYVSGSKIWILKNSKYLKVTQIPVDFFNLFIFNHTLTTTKPRFTAVKFFLPRDCSSGRVIN